MSTSDAVGPDHRSDRARTSSPGEELTADSIPPIRVFQLDVPGYDGRTTFHYSPLPALREFEELVLKAFEGYDPAEWRVLLIASDLTPWVPDQEQDERSYNFGRSDYELFGRYPPCLVRYYAGEDLRVATGDALDAMCNDRRVLLFVETEWERGYTSAGVFLHFDEGPIQLLAPSSPGWIWSECKWVQS